MKFTFDKKSYVYSGMAAMLTALLTFYLDSRAENAINRYNDDINNGLKRVAEFHQYGELD